MSSRNPVSQTGQKKVPRPKRSSSAVHAGFRQPETQQVSNHVLLYNAAAPATSRDLSSGSSGRDIARGKVGAGYGPYMMPSAAWKAGPSAARTRQDSHATDSIEEAYSAPHTNTRALYAAHMAMQYHKGHDPESDDWVHDPKRKEFCSFDCFSARGWANMTGLVVVLGALFGLMIALPVVAFFRRTKLSTTGGESFGYGGINGTGQIAGFGQQRGLIDKDTPKDAFLRTGFDGQPYELVFSDEFEHDGRTFWPGDDPFFEAVDLHYWPTGDLEWYDPDAATTKDGNLVFTISEQNIRGLNYRSGMIQSWNKFCFTGGYIEVSVSLPGVSTVPGFWPGVWTMGNLGRAGYGATTDGVWPYSYNSCDVGTMANQTNLDGTTPAAARTSGPQGGSLSYQPGQKLSACTCPSSAKDHPGPSVNTGRGAPEIDVLEAQVNHGSRGQQNYGAVSQSMQITPYDAGYHVPQTAPGSQIYNTTATSYNSYIGGVYQQAVSAVTRTNSAAYNGGGSSAFATYGFEYMPGTTDGFITWQANGVPSWRLAASAIGPNAQTGIGQRLISEEPMSLILNLGLSQAFQDVDFANLRFPAQMLVDCALPPPLVDTEAKVCTDIRVYQRTGSVNVGCDPASHPTAQYIQNHMNAYTNPNLTRWHDAGYSFPTNRLANGGTC